MDDNLMLPRYFGPQFPSVSDRWLMASDCKLCSKHLEATRYGKTQYLNKWHHKLDGEALF